MPGARFPATGHGPQLLANVEKEFLVSGAEILKARLIVVSCFEAVFGAPALAGRQHFPLSGSARQGCFFAHTKLETLTHKICVDLEDGLGENRCPASTPKY